MIFGSYYVRVIRQFEQRKKDPNLKLFSRVVEESQNKLARYLAEDRALNMTYLVIFPRRTN